MTAPLSMTLKHWLGNLLSQMDDDFLREGLKLLAEGVMEIEVSGLTGAEKYERSEGRKDVRNGYRTRRWDTRVGTLELPIPKLRHGGYAPSFLEPRRRLEKAMTSVIQEAYIKGVSTRKVEDLVQGLGIKSFDKSQVSRLCDELDGLVSEWRTRPLTASYAYLWADAKYLHVRDGSRVVKKALVVAFGVREDGYREMLGVDLFSLESTATWRSFLRSLVERGLSGVELVISDDHAGLRAAIGEVFVGASWQRCIVHFMRNIEGHLPRNDRPAVRALLKSVFAQETFEEASRRLRECADVLRAKKPRVAELLDEAEHTVLTYLHFPAAHHRQLRSTNPLERVNKEIARRVDVVGIFPTDDSVLRLVGALLMEQDDEWRIGKRYFSLGSMALLKKKQVQPETETLALTENSEAA